MRAYSATVGATDGNIIAAIITTHTPRNQPSAPSAVPGPSSMPAIRSAVDHHATAASANSSATSPRRARAAADGGRGRTPGRARAGRRLRRARSPRDVLDRALVRAAPAQLVGQRLVADVQQVGVVLAARPVVPRDHARDGLRVGDGVAHADGDVLAGAEPPAMRA